METSSSFNEAFKHAVTPGTERLLAGVALALQGLALKVKRASSSLALYTSPLPPLGVEAKQVI
jgi:hypothetical protein